MQTKQAGNWYVAKTGNHQGLVVDETTGANIAVTYDRAHAGLVAAAPELLAALKSTLYALDENMDGSGPTKAQAINQARAAIAKATGK